MKTKYILLMIAAVALLLTGCSEKFEPTYLGNISVSQSTVSMSPDAGSTYSIDIKVNGDWTITNIPDWLTVSPSEGSYGLTTVTLTATEATDSRTATLFLNSGNDRQEINVQQVTEVLDPVVLTVREALDLLYSGQASGSVYVKGIVCRIQEISPQYGNATYYLSDDGSFGADNWLQVYRGYWIDGEKFTKGNEFGIGDEMVIKGALVLYNGSVPETQQGACEVVSVVKSLISVASVDIPADGMPKEGGNFTVTLDNKGNGVTVNIPEEAREWLSVVGVNVEGTTTTVTMRAAKNEGAGRKTTVSFVTTADGKEYMAEAAVQQEADVLPHGMRVEDPFTVAEAIAKCEAIGATTDGEIYFAKGYISSISSVDTGSYGNATFNISDDGTDTNALTVFRSMYLDNAKFTAADQIAVGDEVIITGKLVNYTKNGTATPEFSGSVYIVSQKKSEPGTLLKPFTVAEAIAKCQEIGGTSDGVIYYAKGKVSSIKEVSTQYGNATFNISDDGNDTNALTVYRAKGLGNENITNAELIKLGDEVVITGKLVNFTKNDTTTPEFSGSVYIYSINGVKE